MYANICKDNERKKNDTLLLKTYICSKSQPSDEFSHITCFILYVGRQKLLEGVEDSSVGDDDWRMDLRLFLSFKYCHTFKHTVKIPGKYQSTLLGRNLHLIKDLSSIERTKLWCKDFSTT